MHQAPEFWKKCSTCKKPISFGQAYWVCSVSTCNRQRTALAFCDVGCFDAHIPVFNHRDAGAFEKFAPSRSEWEVAQVTGVAPRSGVGASISGGEILVVVSKVKAMIREATGMSTSDAVMEVLSDLIRRDLDRAIVKAKSAGRKTVMERDFD